MCPWLLIMFKADASVFLGWAEAPRAQDSTPGSATEARITGFFLSANGQSIVSAGGFVSVRSLRPTRGPGVEGTTCDVVLCWHHLEVVSFSKGLHSRFCTRPYYNPQVRDSPFYVKK